MSASPVTTDRRHALWLWAALLAWFSLWLAVPMLFDPEIPGDNLEQLDWARHPAWGYAKHPPFPTWILWCFQQVFAPTLRLTYFIGALQVAFLMAMAWRLARASLPAIRPWVALAMVACITYYTSRMHYYNHNTALMTAYAAALLCLWQAVQTGRLRWWLLLGAAWAAGLLSKYQMALLVGCNLLWLLDVQRRHAARILPGLLLACGVCAALLAPHLLWLVHNHFPSFGYAAETLAARLGPLDRSVIVLHFLLHQLGRLAPLLVMLGLLAWRTRLAAAITAPAVDDPAPAIADEARRFWWLHAWGPIAGIALMGLLLGSAVETHWGMASLWAMPFWLLCTQRGRRWATAPPGWIAGCAIAIQALVAIGYVAGS